MILRFLILWGVLFGLVQFSIAGEVRTEVAPMASTLQEPMNCVNEGGGCNGTVPCCQDSYCVRGRCQRVPENDSPVKIKMPQDVSKVCAL